MIVASLQPQEKLNAALAKAQAEFPAVARGKTVKTPSYEYSYADLASIIAAVRPVLGKHGLSFVQLLEGEGIRTELRHASGGLIASVFPWPQMPANPQALGSMVTYLRRYTLCALLGVAAEDDDDAQAAAGGSGFQAPKPKRVRDASGEAEEVVDYLTNGQTRKIQTLKTKLVKLGVFDEDAFDDALSSEYNATVSGLTKTQASHLIDRLERVERELPATQ